MSFDYAKSAATALKLLQKFGSLGRVSIKRSTATLDPIAGKYTGGTEATTQLTAVTVPIDKKLIDGERIKAADIMFLCGSDFQPLMSDTAIIDSNEYKIVHIAPIEPNGTNVLYKVICRG